MKTKVIFRKWKNGDIIALFPEEPGTYDASTCNSYEHNGQHGSAEPRYVIQATTLAKPAEYADLKQELERIGYDLDVKKLYANNMYVARLSELYRLRKAIECSPSESSPY